jgi:hypothetical protein
MVVTNDSHMQRASDRKSHIALKASGWRNRDDEHMGKSQEQLISGYLKDYSYFGHYLRDMEKIVDRGRIPAGALVSIEEIVREVDIRLEPLDSFHIPSLRPDALILCKPYVIVASFVYDPLSRSTVRARVGALNLN